MKIAVSSTGQSKENLLDRRFGRCDYFLIFNTETKEVKAINNQGAVSSGGAGIAAANQVVEEDIEVVITGNLGPNAYELLNKVGIKSYSCDILPVFKAIELYERNGLDEITSSVKGHHGMH